MTKIPEKPDESKRAKVFFNHVCVDKRNNRKHVLARKSIAFENEVDSTTIPEEIQCPDCKEFVRKGILLNVVYSK